jgi:hypothetical protein
VALASAVHGDPASIRAVLASAAGALLDPEIEEGAAIQACSDFDTAGDNPH